MTALSLSSYQAFAPSSILSNLTMADHNHHHHHNDPIHAQAHSHASTAITAANGEDFTEKNRAHWDQNARSYTSEPWQQDMMARLTTFLITHASWIGLPPRSSSSSDRPIRILDYASGPGTITSILGATTGNEWRGLDISTEMCKTYNERFAAETAFTAHAVQGNLLSSNSPDPEQQFAGPEWHDFDMVDVGLGFHHFEDVAGATRKLSSRLRPGGVFMIVDLVSHELEEEYRNIVAHAGFSFEQVKRLFEGEGLTAVDWKVMDGEVMIKGKHPRRVFVARGRKPE
jgi:SAM-dependent methyltransferase